MRRRRYLATVALSTGVLTATAGCQSNDSAERTLVRLDKLWFVNHADDGCDVSVTVTAVDTRGEGIEDIVHEAAFRLEPDANVTRDPDVNRPGVYVVDATVGSETFTVDTTEHVTEANDCVRLKFERSPDGSVELVPTSYDYC